jgi:putative aldouronate transport system substrate-binding protein
VLFSFADKYKTAGYIPAKIPATPSFDRYIGDLIKLSTEAYVSIISGAKPISYFDEYVATFLDRGGKEIMEEVNEAYREMMGR